jgi:hypothetical protein
MRGLKHLKFGKDVMKNEFISSNGLKLGTDLNSLLNSFEKHNFLVFLDGLGIELLNIF